MVFFLLFDQRSAEFWSVGLPFRRERVKFSLLDVALVDVTFVLFINLKYLEIRYFRNLLMILMLTLNMTEADLQSDQAVIWMMDRLLNCRFDLS